MALSKTRKRWTFLRMPRIIFSKFMLWIMGWKVSYKIDKNITKGILLVAPHTSNWDFIIGRLCLNALDIRSRYLIKKELFFFPLGFLLRLWGGVPVNRKKPGNIKKNLTAQFEKYDEFMLVITPEGTRKPNSNWKKGFYRIAIKAKVPIILTYLDYKKKKAEVNSIIHPSGNFVSDIKMIGEFYSTITPKYPDKYSGPKY